MKSTQSAPTNKFYPGLSKATRFRLLLTLRRQVKAMDDETLRFAYLNDKLDETMACMVSNEWDRRGWLWRS
jgi:hypothetical protein